MIEYANEQLFRQHDTAHLVIVQHGATVTPVSGSAPTVTDSDWVINSDTDLTQESFELWESLNSKQNLSFGSMESAYFKFNMYNLPTIPNLKKTWIDIYLYFNEDSSTLFQVGVYEVNTDKYSADRVTREVSGYDLMHFLKDYDITEWYNSVFSESSYISIQDLRESLFEWLAEEEPDIGITMTTQDTDGSLNDDYLVGKTIESDSITFDFFMSRLLEWRGCFGHINRQGQFECKWLVPYDEPAVKVIGNEVRIPPTQYEDDTVWGIGYVAVFDRNNIKRFKVGSSAYKHPSVYKVVDSFVAEEVNRTNWESDTREALEVLRNAVTHRRYKPATIDCIGDLCLEVGDQIDVEYTDDDTPKQFYTYILERHFKGIQGFRDVYSAKGDRKQPKYKNSDNWHVGDSTQATSGDGSDGVGTIDNEWKTNYIKAQRNNGIRFLQEPSNVSVEYDEQVPKVSIKWTDPSDITNYKPIPQEWAGTVVVRKEGSEPWYPWDGEILVDSTTRDEYSSTAFEDTDIDYNKTYYYGIFPYSIIDESDPEHIQKRYRFTKVVSVNTTLPILAPALLNLSVISVNVTATYEIPSDYTWDYVKLVYKKNNIPTSESDGNSIDITGTSATVTNLDETSKYYFVIFAKENKTGIVVSSEPKDITTGIIIRPFIEEITIYKQVGDDFVEKYTERSKWGVPDEVVPIKAGMSSASDTVNFTDATSIQKATIVSTSESDIFTDSVDIELVTE